MMKMIVIFMNVLMMWIIKVIMIVVDDHHISLQVYNTPHSDMFLVILQSLLQIDPDINLRYYILKEFSEMWFLWHLMSGTTYWKSSLRCGLYDTNLRYYILKVLWDVVFMAPISGTTYWKFSEMWFLWHQSQVLHTESSLRCGLYDTNLRYYILKVLWYVVFMTPISGTTYWKFFEMWFLWHTERVSEMWFLSQVLHTESSLRCGFYDTNLRYYILKEFSEMWFLWHQYQVLHTERVLWDVVFMTPISGTTYWKSSLRCGFYDTNLRYYILKEFSEMWFLWHQSQVLHTERVLWDVVFMTPISGTTYWKSFLRCGFYDINLRYYILKEFSEMWSLWHHSQVLHTERVLWDVVFMTLMSGTTYWKSSLRCGLYDTNLRYYILKVLWDVVFMTPISGTTYWKFFEMWFLWHQSQVLHTESSLRCGFYDTNLRYYILKEFSEMWFLWHQSQVLHTERVLWDVVFMTPISGTTYWKSSLRCGFYDTNVRYYILKEFSEMWSLWHQSQVLHTERVLWDVVFMTPISGTTYWKFSEMWFLWHQSQVLHTERVLWDVVFMTSISGTTYWKSSLRCGFYDTNLRYYILKEFFEMWFLWHQSQVLHTESSLRCGFYDTNLRYYILKEFSEMWFLWHQSQVLHTERVLWDVVFMTPISGTTYWKSSLRCGFYDTNLRYYILKEFSEMWSLWHQSQVLHTESSLRCGFYDTNLRYYILKVLWDVVFMTPISGTTYWKFSEMWFLWHQSQVLHTERVLWDVVFMTPISGTTYWKSSLRCGFYDINLRYYILKEFSEMWFLWHQSQVLHTERVLWDVVFMTQYQVLHTERVLWDVVFMTPISGTTYWKSSLRCGLYDTNLRYYILKEFSEMWFLWHQSQVLHTERVLRDVVFMTPISGTTYWKSSLRCGFWSQVLHTERVLWDVVFMTPISGTTYWKSSLRCGFYDTNLRYYILKEFSEMWFLWHQSQVLHTERVLWDVVFMTPISGTTYWKSSLRCGFYDTNLRYYILKEFSEMWFLWHQSQVLHTERVLWDVVFMTSISGTTYWKSSLRCGFYDTNLRYYILKEFSEMWFLWHQSQVLHTERVLWDVVFMTPISGTTYWKSSLRCGFYDTNLRYYILKEFSEMWFLWHQSQVLHTERVLWDVVFMTPISGTTYWKSSLRCGFYDTNLRYYILKEFSEMWFLWHQSQVLHTERVLWDVVFYDTNLRYYILKEFSEMWFLWHQSQVLHTERVLWDVVFMTPISGTTYWKSSLRCGLYDTNLRYYILKVLWDVVFMTPISGTIYWKSSLRCGFYGTNLRYYILKEFSEMWSLWHQSQVLHTESQVLHTESSLRWGFYDTNLRYYILKEFSEMWSLWHQSQVLHTESSLRCGFYDINLRYYILKEFSEMWFLWHQSQVLHTERVLWDVVFMTPISGTTYWKSSLRCGFYGNQFFMLAIQSDKSHFVLIGISVW